MDKKADKYEQNSKTKRRKQANNVYPNSAIAIAIEPKLFEMNVDCFEHVFEFLSLKELLVFRRTCKRIKMVVDYYVGWKYSKLSYERLSWFKPRSEYISQWCKHLNISTWKWYDRDTEYITNILNQLETLRLNYIDTSGDLYKVLLKYCPRLKHLTLQMAKISKANIHNGNEWLHHQYPSLEHFEIETDSLHEESYQSTIDLLNFFKRNPNIRIFSANSKFLLLNRHLLLESNITFDRLSIVLNHDLNVIRNLTDDLFEHKFYKQLHLHLRYSYSGIREHVHHLSAFHNLEKLVLPSMPGDFPLTKIDSITELVIVCPLSHNHQQLVATNLINLRFIQLGCANLQDITLFVRHAPELRQIKIRILIRNSHNEFNLSTSKWIALNEERKKLDRACKITIFIPENEFLKMKWTAKTNFSLIEFKRFESCVKNHVFESW